MTQTDNEFFEAYKHLESLCRDSLKSMNGITEYIVQMENATHGQYMVATWASDYKSLKHIRWVRNRIAHNASVSDVSNDEDIAFTEEFYQRMMKQTDPLAQLRKAEEAEHSRAAAYHASTRNTYQSTNHGSGEPLKDNRSTYQSSRVDYSTQSRGASVVVNNRNRQQKRKKRFPIVGALVLTVIILLLGVVCFVKFVPYETGEHWIPGYSGFFETVTGLLESVKEFCIRMLTQLEKWIH